MERYTLPNDYAVNLTYLTSIAVKDYEVTRLLYERGYVQDQVKYVEHLLTTTEDDITAWRIARSNPLTSVLHLVASLKTPFCALPLLTDERFGKRLEHHLVESLGYLSHERAKILKTTRETPSKMAEDTTENIARVAELIADKIIEPHLAENL